MLGNEAGMQVRGTEMKAPDDTGRHKQPHNLFCRLLRSQLCAMNTPFVQGSFEVNLTMSLENHILAALEMRALD